MLELINRYIKNRLKIEGNIIYIDSNHQFYIVRDVKDIFNLTTFCMQKWVAENISNEYCFEYSGGGQYWYKNDVSHRTDGPAMVHPNHWFDTEWYKDGLRHRTDGPAVIWVNGTKCYYVNGKQYSKEEFDARINR